MSSDDLTPKLPDPDFNKTQPIRADVFRLVEQVKQSMESRFDATDARLDQTNSRLDELDSRLARDTAGINARITEISDEMKTGFIQLSDKIVRSRLHAEADYQDLLRRMRELESNAS
jgi:hypothetical protein